MAGVRGSLQVRDFREELLRREPEEELEPELRELPELTDMMRGRVDGGLEGECAW
jgi:hypothetical protein